MKRLFVWSGGGMLGLDIHVGIWQALDAAGITADANAGTSAGAIMAALNSANFGVDAVERIIRGLCDDDVRSERLLWKLRIPWVTWFLRPDPIYALLQQLLPNDFSGLGKPLTVGTTDDNTARPVLIDRGHLPLSVLASMAICGYFPAVRLFVGDETKTLTDGWTTCNLPLPANWQEFDEVYFLCASRPLANRGHGLIGRLVWNADLMMEREMDSTMTIAMAQRSHPRVIVLRPAVSAVTGSMRFHHGAIMPARLLAKMQLAEQQGNLSNGNGGPA